MKTLFKVLLFLIASLLIFYYTYNYNFNDNINEIHNDYNESNSNNRYNNRFNVTDLHNYLNYIKPKRNLAQGDKNCLNVSTSDFLTFVKCFEEKVINITQTYFNKNSSVGSDFCNPNTFPMLKQSFNIDLQVKSFILKA